MGLLVRVVPIVAYMMEDESTIVLKRLLSCVIQIYRLAILVRLTLKLLLKEASHLIFVVVL